MAISLKWGSFTFPITPKITMRKEPLSDGPGPDAWRKTWELQGELYGPNTTGTAAVTALRDQLDVLATAAVVKSLVLVDDEAGILDSLEADAAAEPLMVSGYSVPPADGTEYVTHVPFSLSISGVFVREKLDTDTPASALQSVWGEYQLTESISGNNRRSIGAQGTFRGRTEELCTAAIDAVIDLITTSQRRLLNKRVTFVRNPPGRDSNHPRVDFSIEFSDSTEDGNVFDYQETLEYQPATTLTIIKPVVGGGPPVFQLGMLTPSIVIQSGQATGRFEYPTATAPLFNRFIEPPVTTKQLPTIGPDGSLTNYGLRWRYAMVNLDDYA